MKELISPNVKYIGGLELDVKTFNIGAQVHPRGIIVIDTENNHLLDSVKECFETYKKKDALYPVNVTGIYTTSGDMVGSERFCAWDGEFAKDLTNILWVLEAPELISENGALYEFISVSKYFRFMRYKSGGEHFPHYDTDFRNDAYVTKYSLVMYFNDCDSGELAFVEHDGIDTNDWERQAYDSEIYLKVLPKAGRIVLFPHTLCHTVLPFAGDERYVVRGDLIFTKVPK